MFGTFVKYQFQRTYDAILAAPVDTEELVTAEALWIAARAGVYGCVPLLVAIFFGLDPRWSMLFVPFIGFLCGYGWACFGIAIAGFVKSIENFSYIISAVLTPLFLVAGTFFPITRLPALGADARRSSTRCTSASCSSATPRSASTLGRPCVSGARRLRRPDVAPRDPGDGAEADRLAAPLTQPASSKGSGTLVPARLGLSTRAGLREFPPATRRRSITAWTPSTTTNASR